MPEILRIPNATIGVAIDRTPSVTTWSRLEPLPVASALGPGLAAPVADPLWLLARQWQFGELRGSDASMPRLVRMKGETMPVTGWRPGGLDAAAVPRVDDPAPLEMEVEDDAPEGADRRRALAAGLQLRRRLTAAGLMGSIEAVCAAFPLTLPAPEDAARDPRGAGWRALAAVGGAIDGAAAVAAMSAAQTASGGASAVPAALAGAAGDATALQPVCAAMLAAFPDLATPPKSAASAWVPTRQEYAFGVDVQDATGKTGTLLVEEHHGGSLDWPDFELARPPAGDAAATPAGRKVAFRPLLPTPARYPGMPAPRHWEFEDTRAFLGRLDAGPTDVARLMLVEFALSYGEDWFVVPLEVEAGSLFALDEMVVEDSFGVPTKVPPLRLGQRPGGPFGQSRGATDPRLVDALFTPPASLGALTGTPLEEVLLLRDELVNLGWAVERRVMGVCGGTLDVRLLAAQNTAALRPIEPVADVSLFYRLQIPAPENWHPLAPVSVSPVRGAIAFERFETTRLAADGTLQPVAPRGTILTEPAPWRLDEQELPRDGALLTRAYRLARGRDGALRLWLGRGKMVGSGEGRSGLRYDTVRQGPG